MAGREDAASSAVEKDKSADQTDETVGEQQRRIGDRPPWVWLGGVGALLVVVVGAWFMVRDTTEAGVAGLPPGEVVSDFFHAQRAGDCQRLIELLSEESWSDGGARSRDEFLDQCAEAVAGYEPTVDQIEFEVVDDEDSGTAEDDDRAVVSVAIPQLEPGVQYVAPLQGNLVLQDGQWKVQTDDVVLRIGPSIYQVVSGYLRAYNEGNCERLIGFLSEAAWSAGGDRSRDEFLEACAAAAEGREGPARPLPGRVEGMEVSLDGKDRATAEVSLTYGPPDTVVLVKQGLRWKLEGSEKPLNGAPPGTRLAGLRYLELQARLVDEIQVSGRRCFNYWDDRAPGPTEDATSPTIRREFSGEFSSPCQATVVLQEFADHDEARAYAENEVEALLEEDPPTAEDYAERAEEYDFDIDPEELADRQQPNQEADVPGIPEALGVQSLCDVDGCDHRHVFLAQEHMLVTVILDVGGRVRGGARGADMDDAVEIVRAQMEKLR